MTKLFTAVVGDHLPGDRAYADVVRVDDGRLVHRFTFSNMDAAQALAAALNLGNALAKTDEESECAAFMAGWHAARTQALRPEICWENYKETR